MAPRRVVFGMVVVVVLSVVAWMLPRWNRTPLVDSAAMSGVTENTRGAASTRAVGEDHELRSRIPAESSADSGDVRAMSAFGSTLVMRCVRMEDRKALPGAVVHTRERSKLDWAPDIDALVLDADPIADIEQRGTRFVADADGLVRMPRPLAAIEVLARSGDLVALSAVDDDAVNPFELWLAQPRELQVFVHDPEGKPVAGVGVQLLRDVDDELVARAVSDERGIVRAEHVRLAAGFDLLRAVPEVPTRTSNPVWITSDDTRVDIVVPRGAPMLARLVDSGGSLVSIDGALELRADEELRERALGEVESVSVPVIQGVAKLAHVPFGAEFFVIVKVGGNGFGSGWIQSPREGETPREATVSVYESISVQQGVLLDPGKAPLRDAWIEWGVLSGGSGDDGSSWWIARSRSRTDRDGKLTLLARTADEYAPSSRLFVWRAGGSGFAGAEIGAPGLARGATRWGTVELVPLEPFASGRVTDVRGGAVERALVAVDQASDENSWSELPAFAAARTDSAGRFALYAPCNRAPARVRISVGGEDVRLAGAEQSIHCGSRALELSIAAAATGTIEGRWIVDEEVAALRLNVTASNGMQEIWTQEQWSEGTFEFFRVRSLSPGAWNVHLRPSGAPEDPGLVVNGVSVIAGETTRDPRLWPIDPRGKFEKARVQDESSNGVTLRITDSDGRPLRHGYAWFDEGDGWLSFPHAWSNGNTSVRGERIAVWSPGMRLRRGEVPRTDETWSLEPAVLVKLHLDVPERFERPELRCYMELELGDDAVVRRIVGQNPRRNFDDHHDVELALPELGEYRAIVCVDWGRGADERYVLSQFFQLSSADLASRTTVHLTPEVESWAQAFAARSIPLAPR